MHENTADLGAMVLPPTQPATRAVYRGKHMLQVELCKETIEEKAKRRLHRMSPYAYQ
jgi:hypothetical protein